MYMPPSEQITCDPFEGSRESGMDNGLITFEYEDYINAAINVAINTTHQNELRRQILRRNAVLYGDKEVTKEDCPCCRSHNVIEDWRRILMSIIEVERPHCNIT